jgi:hypothetical protein
MFPIVAWSLTTAAGVVLFAVVVRRSRRHDEDGVAVGAGIAAAAALAVEPTPPPVTVYVADGWDDEVGVESGPKWGAPTGREPVRFESAPEPGVERRTISHRLVRLSDTPDDLRSREVARLDRGDEVEVIDEDERMFRVRTPTGLHGWVPRISIVG